MDKNIILGCMMNKRKKKWEKEVQKGIEHRIKNDIEYDYYGKLNRRHHINQTKGFGQWINLLIRIFLASALILSQLRGCGIWL
jgi:hypothetical protein